MFRARLGPQPEAVLGWLRELPGPVAVVYEAGPTGYGLARFLTDHTIRCVVAAPPKLLRQGTVWSGGTAWTFAHHDWLRRQTFSQSALTIAYDSALETVLLSAERRDRLDKAIVKMAADPAWSAIVTRLGCLRGVSTLTAFGLTVEVGDWSRFTGSSIGAFRGLVPTEHSSGGSRSQRSITKTGNTHARRLLVEAAWQHRRPYRTPSATLRSRWNQAPAAARARGHAGNQRLHQRWQVFTDRKKRPVVANVAVARELAGWCWSLAMLDDTGAAC